MRSFRGNALTVLALVAALGLAVVLSGCSAGPESTETSNPVATAPTEDDSAIGSGGETLYTPKYVPSGDEIATFETSQGRIVVQLFGADAPIHVGNFIELVRSGFYDDTKFHRYEPGFVVQGGDPQTKDATSEQVAKAVGDPQSAFGTGDPGYSIKGEFDPAVNPNKHIVGALGMARSSSPDSAGSQFYFTIGEAAFLDGQYTVFAQVTEGLDVMEKLRAGDTVTSIKISGDN